MTRTRFQKSAFRLALGATALTAMAGAAAADQVILDDLIVDGSICAGLDCVNGESFGFDTLRLKENNLRIRFFDTSNSASFPTRDWQLTANESSNGGQEKFSIDDIDGGRTPFTIEAGAPSNSLYVDDGGRLGLGTATPVVEVHVKDGDTPTVRLEQDGTSGFTPQTWDMAGNETNWFVRDATNGSALRIRVRPGNHSNSIFVDTDGDVGLGDDSPDAQLDVQGDASGVQLRVSSPSGAAAIQIDAGNDGTFWNINQTAVNALIFTTNATGGDEFMLDATGNLTLAGTLVTAGAGTCAPPNPACDAVFDPDAYTVPSIEEHAKLMWANGYLPAVGPTLVDAPVNLTEKTLRILNELEHAHIYIEELHGRVATLEAEINALTR